MPLTPASPGDTYRYLVPLCAPLNVNITEANIPRMGDVDRTTGDAGAAHGGAAGPGTIPGRGVSAADLAGCREAAAVLVEGESDRIAAVHGDRPRPDVAASRLLHHYLWSVGLLFTGPWYLGRRVPRIPLGAVRVAPRTGALTLEVTALTWAPGDADALRGRVAEHVGPVLEAFAPLTRRGRRALWGMATDDLASGLWFLGRALGEEERGIREAAAVLPGATPPFPGAADFRTLRDARGRRHATRTRLGCCLHYAVTPATADPCLTCPRMPDAERLRRLERT